MSDSSGGHRGSLHQLAFFGRRWPDHGPSRISLAGRCTWDDAFWCGRNHRRVYLGRRPFV